MGIATGSSAEEAIRHAPDNGDLMLPRLAPNDASAPARAQRRTGDRYAGVRRAVPRLAAPPASRAEDLVDPGAGLAVLLGDRVGVGVQGHADVRVTEALLHDLVVAHHDTAH